jgi:phage recombination protein Bet
MTGSEVAVRAAADGGGALRLRPDQVDWDEPQRAALAQLGVADAPRGDQLVLLHVSQRTGLDPFARQIHMIGRKDEDSPGGKKWTIQTGIDGFRLISERHPQYAGALDEEWCGEDGVWRDVWTGRQPPVAARYTVLRKDWPNPVRAVAHFNEYAQRKYNGDLTKRWATAPAQMIAKCAEALARRRAFPQDLSSVYADVEVDHLDNPPPVIVQAERDQAPDEPDWDGEISAHETAGDREALVDLWKLARGMRPNDTDLLERIAQAGERVKAAQAAEPPATLDKSDPADADNHPVGQTQMRRLFALLKDRGIENLDKRLAFAAATLERDDLTSFKQLTADDASQLITQLEQLTAEGDSHDR